MNCTPNLGEPLSGDGRSMIIGMTSSDAGSVFEISGPPDTTHFVANLDGRVILVGAVEGRAAVVSDPLLICPLETVQTQAWAGEKLLAETTGPEWC